MDIQRLRKIAIPPLVGVGLTCRLRELGESIKPKLLRNLNAKYVKQNPKKKEKHK